MPTQEERIAALEQTTISRIDFLNSVNRLALQQAQSANDTYHELTILLGVTGSQGQDIKAIKEDVGTLKEDVGTLKEDVGTLKEDVGTIKERIGSVETTLSEHTALLTQILARLPEKP
jgi:archaellum component FlaC